MFSFLGSLFSSSSSSSSSPPLSPLSDKIVSLTSSIVLAGLSYYLMSRLFKSMDPETKDRSKAKEAELLLLQKLLMSGRRVNPLFNYSLDKYEGLIANDICFPHEIDVCFDDIGGMEQMKENVEESIIIPLKSPQLFASIIAKSSSSSSSRAISSLLSPAKGVLFCGPPGAGKTLLAKAIAKSCDATFINVKSSTLENKWFGESPKLVRAVFTLAEKFSPSIIFVDEADILFRGRTGQEHEAGAQMKSEFMQAWDGITSNNQANIMVLAATNRPFDIDTAILRRLPRQFMFQLPSIQEREKILKVLLKGSELDPSLSLMELSSITVDYSGSDLKELCKYAAMIPIKELIKAVKIKHNSQTNLNLLNNQTEENKSNDDNKSTLSSSSSSSSSSSNVSSLSFVDHHPRCIRMGDFLIALQYVKATGKAAQEYNMQWFNKFVSGQ